MLISWIIATGLILIALAFVVPALLKNNLNTTDVDRNTINVAIYKERLSELEQENLTPEQLALAKQELDKTLAQELDNSATPLTARSSNCWASVIVAFCIPALAMGVYLKLGEPKFLMSPLAQFGDDPQILTNFAEFLAKSNNGQFDGIPNTLLKTALKIDPNHQNALWLSGAVAMKAGHYRLAIAHLERLLVQLPPEAEELKQMLQQHIANAKQRLQGNTAPSVAKAKATESSSTATPTATAKATEIEVHVSLAPTLQDKVNPTDTLFIYATPTDSRMPLAIARKSATELPTSVTLDDSSAMMPNAKLSGFPKVTVWARISRSGDAIPKSGDLQGQVTPIILEQQDKVEVMIDQIVP